MPDTINHPPHYTSGKIEGGTEVLIARTTEEIKAYIDGYNACYEQFCDCLKNRKSLMDAIRKMEKYKAAVNGVLNMEVDNEH